MNNMDPNMRVLLLSAQKDAATIVTKSLHNLGFKNIMHMENGLDALKHVSETHFDFVICDLNIKFITGWLFIKEIKVAEHVPNIPVLLFGKDPAPDSEDALKKYGIIKYMQLPFSESQMSFAIHSTISLFNTSGTIENKFSKAKTSLIKNEVDKAIELYSELRSLTTNSTRSSMGLAQSFIKDNKQEQAETLLKEIATSDDDSPARFLIEAKLALQKNDTNNANAAIHKLLATIPNEFYFSRAVRLYLEFNVYSQAEGICNQALEKKFEVADFYACLAKCKYAVSSYDKALEFITQAESKFGMDPDLYNLRGVCYKKMGQLDSAITNYEEALRLSPNDAKVYFNLAQCAIGQKNYEEAAKYLEACLRIAPKFPHASAQLGEIKERKAS